MLNLSLVTNYYKILIKEYGDEMGKWQMSNVLITKLIKREENKTKNLKWGSEIWLFWFLVGFYKINFVKSIMMRKNGTPLAIYQFLYKHTYMIWQFKDFLFLTFLILTTFRFGTSFSSCELIFVYLYFFFSSSFKRH